MTKPSTFSNIDELENIITNLDTAETREVFIQDGKTTKIQPKFLAVWNINKSKCEAIMSDKYNLVQHQEAFNPILMGIRHLNTEVKGFVRDEGKRVYVDLLFQDDKFMIQPEDGHKINLGLRVSNTYDGSGSIIGKAFAYRSICQNGMIFGKKLFACMYKIHKGNTQVDVFKDITIKIAEFGNELNIAITEAAKDYVEKEVIGEVLEKIGIGKRYREYILSKASELGKMNRWELYNLITNMASSKLIEKSEMTRETYLEKANTLLAEPIEAIIRK